MSDHGGAKSPRGAATYTRRGVLGGMGLAALAPWLPALSRAQGAATPAGASQLPIRTTGLEHLGMVVPDVAAAGKFYGRVFNPQLFKEQKPPLRYYVTLGVGYLALGSRANQPHAFFDHFCALVQDYDPKAMAAQLQAEGLPAGHYGIIPDPDRIGLQLLGVPGGLAKSTEPAGRIVEQDALVQPVGLDHVVLQVADLQRSLQFYRRFFGPEVASPHKDRQARFQVAGTGLVLEVAPSGQAPRVARVCVRVHPFDRKAVSRELGRMGAQVTAGPGHGLQFRDPLGLGFELKAV